MASSQKRLPELPGIGGERPSPGYGGGGAIPGARRTSDEERGAPRHFKRPQERRFTKKERDRTTILFGGLSWTHDYLIRGTLEGMGYQARNLPTPDNQALAVGREFGNRGQCNPTYYTMGNLVKYLQELRVQGEEDIEDRYVFVTAGSCGPCRFGMYEAEYRKALQEAGFPRFRVLLFQQGDGFHQGEDEDALEMTPRFFLQLIKAVVAGDLLNELAYKIRPYEMEPGRTDQALEAAREEVYQALRQRRSVFRALRRAARHFRAVPVDYSRIKPRVKVTGEFWAQTTEGDGNYRLFRYLEAEGAEVLVEPVSTWIDYVFWEQIQYTRDRLGLPRNRLGKKATWGILVQLAIARVLFRLGYNVFRMALGFRPDPLISQKKMARVGGAYYNTRINGGESHMEVGKHILSFQEGKAHLVLSVKPFGCMPSTQSDGVQAKVITDLPESLFLSIETTGDGEVHVYSRIQMKLYEARQRAREEVARALAALGWTRRGAFAGITGNPIHPVRVEGDPDNARSVHGRGADPVAALLPPQVVESLRERLRSPHVHALQRFPHRVASTGGNAWLWGVRRHRWWGGLWGKRNPCAGCGHPGSLASPCHRVPH